MTSSTHAASQRYFYAELTTRLTQNNDSLFTSEVKIFRKNSPHSKEYLRVIEGSNTVDITQVSKSIQFSSVHFDLITQEMLHLQLIGGFHAGPGPH